MKQLAMLVKREYWEHSTIFLYIPAVTTTIFILTLLVILVGSKIDVANITLDVNWEDTPEYQHRIVIEDSSLSDIFGSSVVRLAGKPEVARQAALDKLYDGVSTIWLIILWLVLIFYLLDCLHQDRRDRSILFWHSLPIADSLIVISKLVAGLILAPLLYLGCIAIAHLTLFLVSSLAAINTPVDIWQTLWVPANIVGRWVEFIGMFTFNIIWCWPLFGWLVFISSWVKTMPLLWAITFPSLLVLLEGLFSDSIFMRKFVTAHIFPTKHVEVVSSLTHHLNMATEITIAIGVGSLFVGIAIWQRGRADEM